MFETRQSNHFLRITAIYTTSVIIMASLKLTSSNEALRIESKHSTLVPRLRDGNLPVRGIIDSQENMKILINFKQERPHKRTFCTLMPCRGGLDASIESVVAEVNISTIFNEEKGLAA
jgi:hypothetical protein